MPLVDSAIKIPIMPPLQYEVYSRKRVPQNILVYRPVKQRGLLGQKNR